MRAIVQHLILAVAIAGQIPQRGTSPAVVSGQLLTAAGLPAANIRVVALSSEGETTKTAPTILSVAITDTEGRYQLSGLTPGAYYIAAGVLESLTYFPGVDGASKAIVVTVDGGGRHERMDFRLVTPQPVIVSGRVIDEAGIGKRAVATLNMARIRGGDSETGTATDGAFRFVARQRGAYHIFTTPGGPEAVFMVGDENITDLEVKSTAVRQTIVVEDGGPMPVFDLIFTDAKIDEAPRIVRAGLSGLAEPMRTGDFFVTARGLPGGFFIKSITSRGETVTAKALRIGDRQGPVGIEVILGATASARMQLRGRLTGPGAPDVTRIMLSGPELRDELTTRPLADGSFVFPKLVQGTYTIVTWANDDATVQRPVGVYADTTISIKPRLLREVSGQVIVEESAPLPLKVRFNVSCPSSGEADGLSTLTEADVALNGSFKVALPEDGCNVGVNTETIPYRLGSLSHGKTDLVQSPLSLKSGIPEMLNVSLRLPAQKAVRVRGQLSSTPASLKRIILSWPNTGIPLSITDDRNTIQVAVQANGGFEASLPPGKYPVRLEFLGILPDVPTANFILTVDANTAANAAPVTLVVPKISTVTFHVTARDGARTPDSFVLRMDGNNGMQFVGYSTTVVLSPEKGPSKERTFTMKLPEGSYGFGVGFSGDMTPRIRSFTSRGIDLQKAPSIFIGNGDVDIDLVLEP